MNNEIMERVKEHYNEALNYFPENHIVGIFLQGSQNYQLDTKFSDIDTKLIVLPTFEDIAFNRQAVSHTHVRPNDEHIDFKDIRLMFQTFRKQNINFLEILFTDYKIVNPLYENEWNRIVVENERVAHYNIYSAVKAMRGHALEKYHAMEHMYPSKVEVFDKFQYDPKQLHHLIRFDEYLKRYTNGESFKDCLIPNAKEYLKAVKLGKHTLEEARILADKSLANIEETCSIYTKDSIYNKNDTYVDNLLDNVQLNIMKKSITRDLQL